MTPSRRELLMSTLALGAAGLFPRRSAAGARRLVAPLSASANGEVSETKGEQEMPLVRTDLNKDNASRTCSRRTP